MRGTVLIYVEGRNSGQSEGSLPCRVLDSHSYNFTQGILESRGQNPIHEKRQPTPGTKSLTISLGGERTSEGSAGKGRDWWWVGRTPDFSYLILHRKETNLLVWCLTFLTMLCIHTEK